MPEVREFSTLRVCWEASALTHDCLLCVIPYFNMERQLLVSNGGLVYPLNVVAVAQAGGQGCVRAWWRRDSRARSTLILSLFGTGD